ncbi:alpha-glucosidase [Caloranaerobacter sp. TR13]|uniref:glycoside hydrolase family 13 protein n=1 Tax=Caloranaerobacter sp. TR13 TaxID=1302151 RepID=UPI000A686E4B|nr:alpha-glucosidase [Caloranaerobacter sp. TR13]
MWWKNSIIYEIFPRSFKDSNGDGIGDIQGIISKLDYLKDLGVDAIWLCPVYPSPNNDSGYDVSDYYDIWDELGTMEDIEKLIVEMHKRDMKLIMELVANHTSDEHEWFIESRKSKDNPYRDYYIWRPGKDGKEPNNWLSAKLGGSVWTYDDNTDEYYLHLYSSKQPDLNWENLKVRQEVYNIMRFWFDKGVDGFRMDVINKIAKAPGLPDVERKEGDKRKYLPCEEYYENYPKVHDYLKEMNREVLSKYENKLAMGQTSGVTPEQAYLYTGEDRGELNLFLQFEHIDIDRGSNNKKLPFNALEFKKSLAKWQTAMDGKLWNTLFFGSHDTSRPVSHYGNDKKYRVESAKMLATILFTLKGTPIIYQGEEIGMTNVRFESIEDYRDIRTHNVYRERYLEGGEKLEDVMQDIWELSRDNARTPMQWDDSENAGFTKGKPWIKPNPNYKEINVQKSLDDSNSILHYYKEIIKLRKSNEVLLYGDFRLIFEDDPNIFAYFRELNKKKVLVITNFSDKDIEINLSREIRKIDNFKLLISNYEVNEANIESIKLKPFEARVYEFGV